MCCCCISAGSDYWLLNCIVFVSITCRWYIPATRTQITSKQCSTARPATSKEHQQCQSVSAPSFSIVSWMNKSFILCCVLNLICAVFWVLKNGSRSRRRGDWFTRWIVLNSKQWIGAWLRTADACVCVCVWEMRCCVLVDIVSLECW